MPFQDKQCFRDVPFHRPSKEKLTSKCPEHYVSKKRIKPTCLKPSLRGTHARNLEETHVLICVGNPCDVRGGPTAANTNRSPCSCAICPRKPANHRNPQSGGSGSKKKGTQTGLGKWKQRLKPVDGQNMYPKWPRHGNKDISTCGLPSALPSPPLPSPPLPSPPLPSPPLPSHHLETHERKPHASEADTEPRCSKSKRSGGSSLQTSTPLSSTET